MAPSGLDFLTLILTIIAVVLYASVARVIKNRPVSAEARGAQRGFVGWWLGLTIVAGLGLIFNDVTGIELSGLEMGPLLLVLYALLGVFFAMVSGLIYYLLYLYTGDQKTRKLAILFFVFMMAFTVWVIHGYGGVCFYPDDAGCIEPDNYDAAAGRALSSMEERDAWVTPVFGLLFAVPPLIGAIMYFMLFFKVADATSKYRVAAVSGGIALWFIFSVFSTGLNAVAGQAEADSLREEAIAVFGQLFGILSGLLVLLAYYPPKWAQSKWGVQSLAKVS